MVLCCEFDLLFDFVCLLALILCTYIKNNKKGALDIKM